MRSLCYKVWSLSSLVTTAAVLLTSCAGNKLEVAHTASPATPLAGGQLEKVRFGMLPYGDHTYAVIGAKNGWFKDVGIDFEYQTVKIEDVIPYLKNGTLDAASLPPGILMSSYDNAPEMVCFVFGDLFQGFTIMAQPNKGYQSCEDFGKKGMDAGRRVKLAVTKRKYPGRLCGETV